MKHSEKLYTYSAVMSNTGCGRSRYPKHKKDKVMIKNKYITGVLRNILLSNSNENN